MRRSATVAFALVASLLVASAPPAAAANVSGSLEVAAKSTTNSDFNNASVLNNVSVQNNNVTLGGDTVLEDFEASSPLNTYGGDTGSFQVVSSPTYEGSGALQTIDPGKTEKWISNTDVTIQQGQTLTVRVNLDSTSSNGGVFIGTQNEGGSSTLSGYLIQNSNDDDIRLREISSGSYVGSGFETGSVSTMPKDEWMKWKIRWKTDGTINVTVYDALGNKLGSVEGTDNTYTSGGIGFRAYNNVLEYDYFVDRRKISDTGQYVGSAHDAEEIEELFFNVTLANASADLVAEYSTDGGSTWQVANSTTVTSTGNHTLQVSQSASKWRANVTFQNESGSPTTAKLHDEGVLFDAAAPSGSNPDPTGNITSYDGDISLDVTDADFALTQGDSVTVTATNASGGTIGSTTISSNQTVTFTYDAKAGQNDITWTLEDSYGQTTTVSQTFTTPNTLYIRNVSKTSELVNNSVTVDVSFYGGEGSVVTKTTSDGTLSLDGLDTTQDYVVSVNATGWYNRRTYISDLFEQQAVYLLNKNESANAVEFELDDQTGGSFPPRDVRLLVQRPLNTSNTQGTEFQTVESGVFGSVNRVPATLASGVRYRLKVRNLKTGNTRDLGKFISDRSQTVTLPIGRVSISAEPINESVQIDLSTENSSTGPVARISIVDESNSTEDVSWTLYNESGGNATKVDNGSVTGPIGTYRATVPINSTSGRYYVNVSATHDGGSFNATVYAGGLAPWFGSVPLDPKWGTLIGYVGVVAIGGLAVIVDSRLGAATSVVAATFFTAIGLIAVPVPLLALATGATVLFLVGGVGG